MQDLHAIRGVLLFSSGLLFFASMDATMKYLVAHYPVPVVSALRYFVHVLLMLAVLGPTRGRTLVRTTRTGWVLVRGLVLVAATIFMALALQQLPLAEATAIAFTSPLMVALAAGPLLKEHVDATDWAITTVGFLGILLIARPGGEMDLLGVLYGLGTAAALTAYQLLSRNLAASETTIALLFYSAVVGSIVFGSSLPFYWEGPTPPLDHLLLFVLAGACAATGHFLFTAAYQSTEASVLAPILYLQLVWAGLLGWLVFSHIPHLLDVVGMLVIAAAGVCIGLRSHLKRRNATAALDMEP